MALVACLLALWTACVPARAQGPTVTVRVGGAGGFKLPDKNATDPQSRANRAVVDAFEREYPHVKLQAAQGLSIAGPQAESSLLLAFAGGTAPDVVYVNFRTSAQYIAQGFLQPLDPYIARDPDTLLRLNPVVRRVLADVGGKHIYSLPYAQYVLALYYRKDLFQAAGLDPEAPPRNWDEFYRDAQAITDQPHGVWGFEFKSGPEASAVWWIDFLWQAGGEVVRRNKEGRWEAAFATPEGVKALEFYRKLKTGQWKSKDGHTYTGVATNAANADQDRVQGKCGMWFQYQSSVVANQADTSSINPSLIGIAPLPAGPTGLHANELNAAMWGMSSQIKSEAVREAAWQFIRFMGSDEADRIRTQAYVEAGLGNSVNPESLLRYGYGDFATRSSRAWLAANRTLFQTGHPEPYAENMSQIYTLLGNPLSRAENEPNADAMMLLRQSAQEIDTKLTGYVPPAEMAHRRAGAWAVFALLALAGVGAALWAGGKKRGTAPTPPFGHPSPFGKGEGPVSMSSAASHDRQTTIAETVSPQKEVPVAPLHVLMGRGARRAGWGKLFPYLFMLPALLSVALWAYYPLGRGLVMAFQNFRLLGGGGWVGWDNFIDVFHQPSFWMGLQNSVVYTALTLTIGFFLPILIALGLSEIPRGRVFFRILYYLPAMTAGLAITLMWKLFEASTPDGLFNTLISNATAGHAGPVRWLDDPHTAMLAVVLPAVWASAGPGSIIYLAALQSVPDEMYEAADLDGAGVWTKVRVLTLPTLKPLMLINLLGATIGAFQASQNIFVQTGGGPAYATHTLGLEIFYNAFLFLKFGYATAAAWVMGAMLVGFTLFQLRLTRSLSFTAGRGQ